MVTRCRLLITTLLVCALPGRVLADLITFSDSSFADADWSNSIVVDESTGGIATSSASRLVSGGNPDSFRNDLYTFPYGANPPETVRIANMNSSALFDPSSQGGIVSLSFSLDYNLMSQTGGSPGTQVGIALLQSSTYFLGPDLQSFSTMGSWQTLSGSVLTAADFSRIAGAGPSNPDFSGLGSVIQFGYGLGIGAGVGDPTLISSSFGVDNWSVELQSVPAPPAAWLLATALSGLGLRRFARVGAPTRADHP